MAEGPFDRFLSPFARMRRAENVEDRREEEFPWHKLATTKQENNMTPTAKTVIDRINGIVIPEDIPAVTSLSRDLGARDIGPIPKEELLKFIIDIENMNSDLPTRRRR
jgi:hypothetical protein